MKNKIVNILAVIGALSIVLSIVLAIYVAVSIYVLNYRVVTIDKIVSPDSNYTLIFQQKGKPAKIRSSKAIIILRKGKKLLTMQEFYVNTKGRSLTTDNWVVTWHKDCVEVLMLSAEEHTVKNHVEYTTQYAEQYTLNFNGSVKKEEFDNYIEVKAEKEHQEAIEKERQEEIKENQRKKLQMTAIYEYLTTQGYLANLTSDPNAEIKLELDYNAKGNLKGTVCTVTEKDGSQRIQYLMYHKYVESKNYDRYVMYEDRRSPSGEYSHYNNITDFYAVDRKTNKVTDLHTTNW